MATDPLLLTGRDLTLSDLARVALDGAVAVSEDGMARVQASRAVLEAKVDSGQAIYGVSTGLGSRATEALDKARMAEFSKRTIAGRAHAIGDPLPAETVRAAMILRLNGFLLGASGVSPALVTYLADFIRSGATPVVGRWGSIGAADLMLGGRMALAMLGEGGEIEMPDGTVLQAEEALPKLNLTPPEPAPRDGLALISHGSFSAATAGLALARTRTAAEAGILATAMLLFGFQANLTPLDPDVMALKPHSADAQIAARWRELLADAAIADPANARRLQDPLSLRNAVQVRGTLESALTFAEGLLTTEINASSDNPAVLAERESAMSTGNYHTPHVTLACDTAMRGLVGESSMILGRVSKMMSDQFTDLPRFLAAPEGGENGFAPMMKLAESLHAEIVQRAQPVPQWPSVSAIGVEDALTHSMTAALQLTDVAQLYETMVAIELMTAAQAADLRADNYPPNLSASFAVIHSVSRPLKHPRPMYRDVEAACHAIREGRFQKEEI